MTRITAEMVYQVCEDFAKKGQLPTIKQARVALGNRGSESTINKYIKKWLGQILKASAEPVPCGVDSDLTEDFDELQNANEAQQQLNEALSRELVKIERENLSLSAKNEALTQNLAEISVLYDKLKIELQGAKKAVELIEQERQAFLQYTEQQKDKLILRLQNELHEVHQSSIQQIADLGQRGDEALIQEKVKAINLKEQNQKLDTDVKRLNKELKTSQAALGPIKAQLKKLRNFVQEVVSFEELQAYERRNIEQMIRHEDG